MLYAYIAWEPYFTMFTINKTLVLIKKKKKKSSQSPSGLDFDTDPPWGSYNREGDKNKMLSFDLFRRSSNKQMDPQFP